VVFVFIWLPKLSGNIGHGSMQVGSSYVSNWPGSLRAALLYGPGHAMRNFDDDKAAEGGLPELAFKLKGLDEDAMRAKWAELKQDLAYSFAFKNCFETVAEVMDEGLSFLQSAAVLIPVRSVLVHAALVTYVHNVSLALGDGIPTNLMSNSNIFKEAYDKARQSL
jgi:hypothetical protein